MWTGDEGHMNFALTLLEAHLQNPTFMLLLVDRMACDGMHCDGLKLPSCP